MSAASSPTPPADRYGRAGTRPGRRGRVAAWAAIAAAVAVTAWLAVAQYRDNPVTADVVGFDVVGPEQVDVEFQVSMPPGTTAVCTVEALSETYAQVGTLEVPVGPSDRRTTRYAVTVRTSELATTGVVERCAPS